MKIGGSLREIELSTKHVSCVATNAAMSSKRGKVSSFKELHGI